ncbi:MAG TPA: RNA-binding cell elongation regulator Jag/EloR [Candidatus Limnocylindria bacterium]|jgi:spoIIIJ-associated protein
MTFREFSGKNVEEAIRTAMKEFGAELSDLDIEILSQGSRGLLGVGGEEARILAAPKSLVAAAETVRVPEPMPPEREPEQAAPSPADEAASPERSDADLADDAAADAAADQVAELARAEANRRGMRGGRGRGGPGRDRADRPSRDGRPRREPREPREPRADRPAREPAPFIPAKPLEELTEAERGVLEEAKSVLEELLRLMGVPGAVEIAMGSETSKLNVTGSDLGVLIGRRGEKLASLQHLVNLIVAKREGQWNRIAVDVENYRGRREDQLRDVADRAAKRVIQSGKIIQLEPMPALERRIVHMALVENPSVRTQSVGVEPNRRIVVLPATKVQS